MPKPHGRFSNISHNCKLFRRYETPEVKLQFYISDCSSTFIATEQSDCDLRHTPIVAPLQSFCHMSCF